MLGQRRREKTFGTGRFRGMDRNEKARIVVYARAYSARHRRPGQHRGPITRAYMEVLAALLWGFHNSKTGWCFPSYEKIAAKAECCRDTVYEAIKALEAAGILTWANRLVRVKYREHDLFGQMVTLTKIVRTSNSYYFNDLFDKDQVGAKPEISKSENRAGTQNQDLFKKSASEIDPKDPMEVALNRLKAAMGDQTTDR
jgi:hypothetical protein